ncbi:MAG: thiol reductase thioredoxin [Rhizobacter sp.]|nr:thiol reductase thioredoxin [Rhizobacter sp.]
MNLPKFLAYTAVASLAFLATIASAGEIKPYSQKEFDTLTHAGKPVVLDIRASWCPTCKAQQPIIDSLMKQPVYQDVTMLTIDFDSQKKTVHRYKVTMQSTLVAFKGDKEVGRSVGDTTPAGLEGLMKKTVN